jgi:hypothetical protein
MKLRLLPALALLVVLAALSVALQSDQTIPAGFGAVAGEVIDARTRKPIADATVVAERDDIEGSSKVPHATTDEEGKFFLSEVPPGRYVMAASKEQDYYPDIDNAAFAVDLAALPKVSVRAGQVTGGVVVPVEKGGKLLGVIQDSRTRAPVVSALIRVSRVDNPKLWLRTGPDIHGHFELVIPDCPFNLEVTAAGYRRWTFDQKGREVLQVKPETTKELLILLEESDGRTPKGML